MKGFWLGYAIGGILEGIFVACRGNFVLGRHFILMAGISFVLYRISKLEEKINNNQKEK